ncbi:hypothetical protein SCYZ1_43 [Pseudomonas phage SCYZ1]|nr:hypothetical protein SCYZ1_43 [Pseudomonas phage SCYZ1]
MINLISRTNIQENYSLLAKGLVRALDKTTLGDYWSLDDLYQHIINFECYAFHQVESAYSGAFMITTSPKRITLNFFWSGKDPDNTVPVDYEEVNRMLEESARHFGCHVILCEGRSGWKKVLEPLGFEVDSINYTREVKYELPPI